MELDLIYVDIDNGDSVINAINQFDSDNGENLFAKIRCKNIKSFELTFNKFINYFFDYRYKIKSVSSVSEGSIFEDTVKVVSKIEDTFDICVDHLTIPNDKYEDIKRIIDFYYDDLSDASLHLGIEVGKFNPKIILRSPIEIISFIDRNSFKNISMSLNFDTANPFYSTEEVFTSLKPYLGSYIKSNNFKRLF